MKKTIALLAALVLAMLCGGSALAEDLTVQILVGPGISAEPLTLDDMKLGESYNIDGYARVTPAEYLEIDHFAQFKKDANYAETARNYDDRSKVYTSEMGAKGEYSDYYKNAGWQDSGENADFVWLKLDVTNLQKSAVNFAEEMSVKVYYAEEYEFAGWVRQINYDYTGLVYRYKMETKGGPNCVINPENVEAIDMLYTGTYVVGCTLPNVVFQDKQPMKIVIMLGGNELTYHIRK